MKKTICLTLALAMLAGASGCSRNNQNNVSSGQAGRVETLQDNDVALNSAPYASSSHPSSSQASSSQAASSQANQLDKSYEDKHLNGLKKDEYNGIEMTAAVLPRMAILPGSAIPVTITVKNNGDKTIVYTQGSGGFQTPTALSINIPELQPVMAKDQLGAATMDFVSKELKPNETLTFTTTVMAIEPHTEFNNWTHEYHGEGDDLYIGDLAWQDLQERHPELKAIKAGTYQGHVYFTYYVLENGSAANPVNEPTGYAQTDFSIAVTE